MVVHHGVCDTEVDPTPHVPDAPSVPAPQDWRRLYEQTFKRAEAAEVHAEELKWAEVAARCDAGAWKSRFEASRRKRLEAVEDANKARRAAKNALFLEAEVARLSRLLEEAGVDTHDRGKEMSLRREVHRLRKAVPGAKRQTAEMDRLRKALRKGYEDQARVRHLLHEALRLNDGLKGKCGRLRSALKRSVAAKEGLKVRVRRATAPAAADADLREALRRSRRHKPAMTRLSKENNPAALDREETAAPDRDAGDGDREAPRDPGDAVQGVSRVQERDA